MRQYAFLFVVLITSASFTGYAAAQQTGASTTQTADVPHSISYQGVLTDAEGVPMPDGVYSITVRLYGDATGKTIVWQDTYSADVRKGVFGVQLGGGSVPLPTRAMSASLWLGIQPAGYDELKPLTALSASPYSLGIADSSITASKMATNYIAGIAVNGIPVTGKGAYVNIVSGGNASVQFDPTSNSIIFGSSTKAVTANGKSGTVIQDEGGDGDGNGEGNGDGDGNNKNCDKDNWNKHWDDDGLQEISANSPLTASTDDNGNVTLGLSDASSGQIIIGQGSSSNPAFETVGGDMTLASNGTATVTGIQGVGVSSTAPTSNQVLQYNSTTKKWTPTTFSGGTTYTASSPLSISNTNVISLGTVPAGNGGTGATTLTGYVYGNGTGAMTASTTIPASAISGNIGGNAANVTGTVAVGNGGTGAKTLTSNGVLIGNGMSAISATAAPTAAGQVLEWNGSAWVPSAISVTGAVTSVAGTTGQINVAPTTGAVTLSLASIETGATVGSSSQVPVFTYDNYGRVTSNTNTPISIGHSQISDWTTATSGFETTSALSVTLAGLLTISSLSGYETISALNTTLGSYETTSALNSTLSNYETISALNSTLAGYATTSSLNAYELSSNVAGDAKTAVNGESLGGDLSGNLPNPQIASTAGTGLDIITAINKNTSITAIDGGDVNHDGSLNVNGSNQLSVNDAAISITASQVTDFTTNGSLLGGDITGMLSSAKIASTTNAGNDAVAAINNATNPISTVSSISITSGGNLTALGGTVTLGAAGNPGTDGSLVFEDKSIAGHTTAFNISDGQTGSIKYTLPSSQGSANQILTLADNAGTLSWVSPATSNNLLYNTSSEQTTATAGNYLFNIGYSTLAAGNQAAGAEITSISGSANTNAGTQAYGLTISAMASVNGTGTANAKALVLSASGGTTNYDIYAGSGNFTVTEAGAITGTSMNLGTGAINSAGDISIDGSAATRYIKMLAPATGNGNTLSIMGAPGAVSGYNSGGSLYITGGAGTNGGPMGSVYLNVSPSVSNTYIGNSNGGVELEGPLNAEGNTITNANFITTGDIGGNGSALEIGNGLGISMEDNISINGKTLSDATGKITLGSALDLHGNVLEDKTTNTSSITLGSSMNLEGNALITGSLAVIDGSGNVTTPSINITGQSTEIHGETYTWPASQASSYGQVLTNKSGTLSWSNTDAGPVVLTTSLSSSANYSSGTYTVQSTDYIIGCDIDGITVSLPSCSSVGAGKTYIIKDQAGSASSSNITISPSGTQKIDGQSSRTLTVSYGSVRIYTDGSNWYTW